MSRTGRAGVGGALAMSFVGGSVAVSAGLSRAPFLTVQALRYAVAAALLVALCALTGRRIQRPRGVEWLWLAGVTGCGLILFNVALIVGGEHAEPAVLGVAVACVPVVLAAVGPLLEGSSPTARAVLAAAVVTLGAALVEGFGRSDAVGLVWAVVVFACEAGFTLLAMPLFARHSPFGVSVHTTWLAAAGFALPGVWREGPRAVLRLDATALAATAFLAVFVTAGAFVLWYGCVASLGAARAGLLTGIAPVAAAMTGVSLGHPFPGIGVWAGVAVVATGLALGLRSRHATPATRHSGEATEPTPV
ncbi:DMT family transporter [Flexivirga sp. ID2601S]|uniref:DMT family transporter n=1 Tax=Flexivirga aerilata TaxID=1656889 RepID=A0A849AHY5_9MICO|nr:DMT family transporter [Flexivirga aerilata]NNG38911.1 DMT family transporter [Flexivirga aerilata]